MQEPEKPGRIFLKFKQLRVAYIIFIMPFFTRLEDLAKAVGGTVKTLRKIREDHNLPGLKPTAETPPPDLLQRFLAKVLADSLRT